MRTLFELVYRLALALWIGSLAFFSFVVAPILFRSLEPAAAGEVAGAILTRYGHLAVACGALAALAAIALARLDPERSGRRRNALIVTAMIILTVYAGQVIAPATHELRLAMHEPGLSRSATADRRAAFDRMHRRAVVVAGGVLLLGGVLFAVEARAAAQD